MEQGDALLYYTHHFRLKVEPVTWGVRQSCFATRHQTTHSISPSPPRPKPARLSPTDVPSIQPQGNIPFDCIFINLASRPDRFRRMADQLLRVQLPAKRLGALTGDDAPPEVVTAAWDSSLNSQFDLKTLPAVLRMSPGERGCAASHHRLWHAVARRPDDGAPLLVLEDDIVLCDDFVPRCAKLVERVSAVVAPAERNLLLYVGGEVPRWRGTAMETAPHQLQEDKPQWLWAGRGCQLLRAAAYVWQTSSYLLFPVAARVLLSYMPIDGPVDVFLSKLIYSGRLQSLVAVPALAWQAEAYCNGDILHTNVYKPTSQKDPAPPVSPRIMPKAHEKERPTPVPNAP